MSTPDPDPPHRDDPSTSTAPPTALSTPTATPARFGRPRRAPAPRRGRPRRRLGGIVARYTPMLQGRVRRYRLQDADAHDVIQVTWLRLAQNLDRIHTPAHLAGWLAAVASHECLRVLHEAKRTVVTAEAGYAAADPDTGPEQLAGRPDQCRGAGDGRPGRCDAPAAAARAGARAVRRRRPLLRADLPGHRHSGRQHRSDPRQGARPATPAAERRPVIGGRATGRAGAVSGCRSRRSSMCAMGSGSRGSRRTARQASRSRSAVSRTIAVACSAGYSAAPATCSNAGRAAASGRSCPSRKRRAAAAGSCSRWWCRRGRRPEPASGCDRRVAQRPVLQMRVGIAHHDHRDEPAEVLLEADVAGQRPHEHPERVVRALGSAAREGFPSPGRDPRCGRAVPAPCGRTASRRMPESRIAARRRRRHRLRREEIHLGNVQPGLGGPAHHQVLVLGQRREGAAGELHDPAAGLALPGNVRRLPSRCTDIFGCAREGREVHAPRLDPDGGGLDEDPSGGMSDGTTVAAPGRSSPRVSSSRRRRPGVRRRARRRTAAARCRLGEQVGEPGR